MIPVTYITLPSPSELDCCVYVQSQQVAGEGKTSWCLLEAPLMGWYHTKSRNKGLIFSYFWKILSIICIQIVVPLHYILSFFILQVSFTPSMLPCADCTFEFLCSPLLQKKVLLTAVFHHVRHNFIVS